MKENLVIAFGGISPEHEVSVITAMQAVAVLSRQKYNLIPLYISKSGHFLTGNHLLELETYKELKEARQNAFPCTFSVDENGFTRLTELKARGFFGKPVSHTIDVLLTAFHGADGENGSFQGLCEQFNIPYTGSGPMASSVGMDKKLAKTIAKSLGMPVVRDVFITESLWVENRSSLLDEIRKLGPTVFIKPVHLGSSIGVQKASSKNEIEIAIETGFRFDDQLIVEEAIQPLMEVNCSVLGDYEDAVPSVCEQPLGSEELLTFEDKYMGDSGKGMASATRIIPAPIDEKLAEQIRQNSVKLFRNLNASGVARLDFLVNRDTGAYYFNEINTIPGSFAYYLWDKTGMKFPELVEKLLQLARKRHQSKNGRVRSFETNLLSQKAVKGIKGLKGKA